MENSKVIADVLIYGASHFGRALATELENKSVNYEFIDSYAERDLIPGKHIYRPNEININEKSSLDVYLTVFRASIEEGADMSLTQDLEQMGFDKVLNPYQTMELFPQILKNLTNDGYLWRQANDPEYYNSAALDLVMGYLSDDRSRELLDNIARFRKDCTFANYIRPDVGPEYAPNGIELTCGLNQLRIVDCGAYNGDTINQFFNLYGDQIETYYAFEPDLANYQKLLKVAKQIKQEHSSADIMCLQAGVGGSNQTTRFSSAGASSQFSDKGDLEVFSMQLDGTLSNSSVNLLKVDVEGEDLAVLKGAEQLIRQQKPNLAVSCYHRPGHIWQIPEFLKSINSDYKMFLRQHGHLGMELTLYCIDKSRF
jgi:FkbM family methyltransferase